MTRRLAGLGLLLVAATLLAGCGGGSSAEDVLSDTASNLGDIKSGNLTLHLAVEGGGAKIGFDLTGPFALPDDGDLPIADLDYTQRVGDQQETISVISTGEKAYLEIGGKSYELPADRTDELRGSAGSLSTEEGGLETLEIDTWLENPKVSDGGQVGGAETDHVSSPLDVVNAANDLLELVASFGGGTATRIEGKSAEQLRAAVKKATIDVWTGKDDRLLRRLTIDAELGADVPEELRTQLGDLANAHFTFELGVSEPNEDVSVEAPKNSEPLPENFGA